MQRESFLDRIDNPALRPLCAGYLKALLAGDRRQAQALVLDAAKSGANVRDLYLSVLQPAQYEIGRLWQMNRVSVAVEHFCTAATQLVISQLFPYILSGEKNGLKMVGCCVGGELHELGMRMVSDFFEMDGWDGYYLGANTPDKDVVSAIKDVGADLLGISVTMLYNVRLVSRLISAVRAAPGLLRLPILVGGFPFLLNPSLVAGVGADCSAKDAQSAVETANRLVGLGALAANAGARAL